MPGAYLFMEGRFFVDIRDPLAEDYTIPIRDLCRCAQGRMGA